MTTCLFSCLWENMINTETTIIRAFYVFLLNAKVYINFKSSHRGVICKIAFPKTMQILFDYFLRIPISINTSPSIIWWLSGLLISTLLFGSIYLFIVINNPFCVCSFKYLTTQLPSFSDMPAAWRHEKEQILSINHENKHG